MTGQTKSKVLAVLLAAALPVAVGCAPAGTLEPARFSTLPPGHSESNVYYPKGDVTESVLMMRTSGPKTVRSGEEFEYKIELYNPTDMTIIRDIVVTNYLSSHFELISSTPNWSDLNVLEDKDKMLDELRESHTDLDDVRKAPPRIIRSRYVSCPEAVHADRVRWYIEELFPEKLVTIRVRGKAKGEGSWRTCASASYDLSTCLAAKIVSPELKLTTLLPRQFILCGMDQTDLTMRVSNTGSGKTEDVTVTAQLPQGLSYEGGRVISEHVGMVPAGETETITKPLRVHEPGDYVVQATATSKSGLSTDAASVTLTAREAELDISIDGPREEYVGLAVEYDVTVKNIGNAATQNLMIEAPVPNGSTFVDASHGGGLASDTVQWKPGELKPGESITLSVRFMTADKGYIRSVATAQSKCASDVTAIARTKLEGVASMVVEVVDNQDPIRIGETETYEIRVKNQGSAPETNVMVSCKLPDGQEFISAEGTTNARSRTGAKQVILRPVPKLTAGQEAKWKIKVRGTRAGDMRFRVAVDSDQHGRPVRETEATRVFD